MQYNDIRAITIANLVETNCSTRYTGQQKSGMNKSQNLMVIS